MTPDATAVARLVDDLQLWSERIRLAISDQTLPNEHLRRAVTDTDCCVARIASVSERHAAKLDDAMRAFMSDGDRRIFEIPEHRIVTRSESKRANDSPVVRLRQHATAVLEVLNAAIELARMYSPQTAGVRPQQNGKVDLDAALAALKPLLKQEFESGRTWLDGNQIGRLLSRLPCGDHSTLNAPVIECLKQERLIEEARQQLVPLGKTGKFVDPAGKGGFLYSGSTKDGYRILPSIRTESRRLETSMLGRASVRQAALAALRAAKVELDLARQQETTVEGLNLRTLDSAVQAARAVAMGSEYGLCIPGDELLPLIQRPLTDENALMFWKLSVCPTIRSMTATLKARSGHHDFPVVLTDATGKVLGKDGKPLERIIENDSDGKRVSGKLSGEAATVIDGYSEIELLVHGRRKAADWSFIMGRLIEIIDDISVSHQSESLPTSEIQTSDKSGLKAAKRGRRPKLVEPDAELILRTYQSLRNIKATVAQLGLQPKGKISALKRVERIVNRDRSQRSRDNKRRDKNSRQDRDL